MTTAIKKSRVITNRDSLPVVASNSQAQRGNLLECVGSVEAATTDAAGSTYIFGTVPSNARMSAVLLSCDALTSGAMDVGLSRTTTDGSAVVDADFFASAVALGSALVHSNVTHEADAADAGTSFGLQDAEKPIWECLGLASDPGYLYDIVGTITTVPGAPGTVDIVARYAI